MENSARRFLGALRIVREEMEVEARLLLPFFAINQSPLSLSINPIDCEVVNQ